MACFIVPTAEAVITTIVTKIVKSKEKKSETVKIDIAEVGFESVERTPFSQKLKWLSNLLWGGSVLLAFEHIWHGEIMPQFPFLTAATNVEATMEMLHEMATAGVTMAIFITIVWLGMVAATYAIEKRGTKLQLGSKQRRVIT